MVVQGIAGLGHSGVEPYLQAVLCTVHILSVCCAAASAVDKALYMCHVYNTCLCALLVFVLPAVTDIVLQCACVL